MNEKIILKNATGLKESCWLLESAWNFASETLGERRGRRRGCIVRQRGTGFVAYVYMTEAGTCVSELVEGG
jgi:hypothetical protein